MELLFAGGWQWAVQLKKTDDSWGEQSVCSKLQAVSLVSIVNSFHTVQNFSAFANTSAEDAEHQLKVLGYILALQLEQISVFSGGGQLQWNNIFSFDHKKLDYGVHFFIPV